METPAIIATKTAFHMLGEGSMLCTHPGEPLPVLEHADHVVIRQAVLAGEVGESAIVPAQPVTRADPHDAVSPSVNGGHPIADQTVFAGQADELGSIVDNDSARGTEPEPAISASEYGTNETVEDGFLPCSRGAAVVDRIGEEFPVESADPIVAAEPQVSLPIFGDGCDVVTGQPVRFGENRKSLAIESRYPTIHGADPHMANTILVYGQHGVTTETGGPVVQHELPAVVAGHPGWGTNPKVSVLCLEKANHIL